MSYEGYEQHICANGHWFETEPSCYFSDDDDDAPKCHICLAKSVFYNCVDDTNGESFGVILPEAMKLLELTPMVVETCNLGHKHITKKPTYRIPTTKEKVEIQSYYDIGDNEHHPVSDYEKNWERRQAV